MDHNYEHLKLKVDRIPNMLICEVCGGTYPLHMPATPNIIEGIFKAFKLDHKYCKEKRKKNFNG